MTEKEKNKFESEHNHEKYEQIENNAQTSTASNLPNKTAYNINDLNSLEFNSADEVRQTMKAILVGKGPKFDETAEDVIEVKNAGDHELQRKRLQQHLMSKVTETDNLNLGNDNNSKTSKPLLDATKCHTGNSRKRPGRPPKAGPSKKLKKQSVATMYLGKLSNVVFLKRFGSGSGSDIESLDFL